MKLAPFPYIIEKVDEFTDKTKKHKTKNKKELRKSMRTIPVSEITENIQEMCIEANHFLSEDMKAALGSACQKEEAELGKQILDQLQENLTIAGEDMIPICQDTGMAVIFLEIGQEVHFEGGSLEDAVN